MEHETIALVKSYEKVIQHYMQIYKWYIHVFHMPFTYICTHYATCAYMVLCRFIMYVCVYTHSCSHHNLIRPSRDCTVIAMTANSWTSQQGKKCSNYVISKQSWWCWIAHETGWNAKTKPNMGSCSWKKKNYYKNNKPGMVRNTTYCYRTLQCLRCSIHRWRDWL